MAFYGGKSQQCQDWANQHEKCNGKDGKFSPYDCACGCHQKAKIPFLCRIGLHRWIAPASEMYCTRCHRWEDDIYG